MPDKSVEIKTSDEIHTLVFVYQNGEAPWPVLGMREEANDFIMTAVGYGAAIWRVAGTVYVFQPLTELPRRLKR